MASLFETEIANRIVATTKTLRHEDNDVGNESDLCVSAPLRFIAMSAMFREVFASLSLRVCDGAMELMSAA